MNYKFCFLAAGLTVTERPLCTCEPKANEPAFALVSWPCGEIILPRLPFILGKIPNSAFSVLLVEELLIEYFLVFHGEFSFVSRFLSIGESFYGLCFPTLISRFGPVLFSGV